MLEVHGAAAAEVRDLAPALPILSVEPFGAALHVRVAEEGPSPRDLLDALARRGGAAPSVTETAVTLEDVFLRVVGGVTPSAVGGGP